jgi:hypothetical protein
LKSPLLYELQSTGMLCKVPSRELRAALGELLSLNKLVTPFYEMSLRTLTARTSARRSSPTVSGTRKGSAETALFASRPSTSIARGRTRCSGGGSPRVIPLS